MNAVEDNLSIINTKKAYVAPSMELLVMNPNKDLLLVGSPADQDSYEIEEGG